MKKKEKKPTVSFRPTSEEHQTLKAFAKAAHNVSVAKYCEEHFRSFFKEHLNTLKAIHTKEDVSGKTFETHESKSKLDDDAIEVDLSDLTLEDDKPNLLEMPEVEFVDLNRVSTPIPNKPKVELGGSYKIPQEPCKKEEKQIVVKKLKSNFWGI
ncbi:MAG: hypothetical protein HY840_15450 [Bacteroidetes bacterium]|nr:hypothetical protein [Bacteroidota bacterium]